MIESRTGLTTLPHRFIWFRDQIGHVQQLNDDGSLIAWFPADAGAPGYTIRLESGEWSPG